MSRDYDNQIGFAAGYKNLIHLLLCEFHKLALTHNRMGVCGFKKVACDDNGR